MQAHQRRGRCARWINGAPLGAVRWWCGRLLPVCLAALADGLAVLADPKRPSTLRRARKIVVPAAVVGVATIETVAAEVIAPLA